MATKDPLTAHDISCLLDQKHLDSQKSMVVFEVANGTGGTADRWADAVVFEFWPSNDFRITGYEFKVSRSDWLSEMKQPEKSQAISQYCDHWYLVAPAGVLGIDELPKGWGYIQATKKSLRTKIQAPQRDAIEMDRVFAASLMRNVINKYGDQKLLGKIWERARKEAKTDLTHSFDRQIKRAEDEAKKSQEIIDGFRKTTGVSLSSWNYERTALAIAQLQSKKNRLPVIEIIRNRIIAQKEVLSVDEKALAALEGWPETSPTKE